MAESKIAETPDFVNGLLDSADAVAELRNLKGVSPRVLLTKLQDPQDVASLSPKERRELGIYQARVVLMVLAAELALKFLWERHTGTPAKQNHRMHEVFKKLTPTLQAQIQSEYNKGAKSPPPGWKNADDIFELCNNASVQWRYLVETNNFPDYEMQATYLKLLTRSILQVAKTHKE